MPSGAAVLVTETVAMMDNRQPASAPSPKQLQPSVWSGTNGAPERLEDPLNCESSDTSRRWDLYRGTSRVVQECLPDWGFR